MTTRPWTKFRRMVGNQLKFLCIDRSLSTRKQHATRASVNDKSSTYEGLRKHFLVPGATVATILMLGALHARRLYEDKKVDEAREKGIEIEFKPDIKASFLRALPLRSISRAWGFLTSTEIPLCLRPYVYKAWARAFHKNIEEIALPLEEYVSLQEFFAHALKEGLRSIDPAPQCLVSPVDGIVLRFGVLKDSEGMIDQVKGFSYSASSLLGGSSCIPMSTEDIIHLETNGQEHTHNHGSRKTWWRVSLASPKMRLPEPARETKGLFYCVLYLRPGDYHRIHSPVDWNVLIRRHFSGRLFPVNERATRTVRNLYIENERVVLEGRWNEGFMALAAIGATNIGSIKLLMEPEMHTNRAGMWLHTSPAEERLYEPEGSGVRVKKGEEVAAFHMGSTVVLVFQAPAFGGERSLPGFQFCVKGGDIIRVGEALGRWM